MYEQQILDLIQYQTDLQFGLRTSPVDINDTSLHTADVDGAKRFYYGLLADATANAVIATAKDINGNTILIDFAILAGQRMDGAFSEITLTSGRVYTQLTPFYNPLIKIKG